MKKTEKNDHDDAPISTWKDPGKPRDLMEELRVAEEKTYAVFHVKTQFLDLVLGAAPAMLDATLARLEAAAKKHKIPPEVLERFKAEMVARYAQGEQTRREIAAKSAESEAEVDPDAVKETDAKGLSTFALDWDGLYLESRCVKSMIRDVLSMQNVFVGTKGSKAFHNLGMFVEPYRLRFIVNGEVAQRPHGIRTYPAIISDSSGKRSALVSNEYLEQPVMEFDVLLTVGGKITKDHLVRCLAACQRVGCCARRSQGFGQFKITEFVYGGTIAKLLNEDHLDELLNAAEEDEVDVPA
jgi:hypothetical protein